MGFVRSFLWGIVGTLATFSAGAAPAQYAYRISFSDKLGSPQLSTSPAWLSQRAITRRNHFGIALDSTDRPVSPLYVDTVLQLTNGVVHTTSRWLNTCVVLVTDTSGIQAVRGKAYVTSAEWVGYFPSGLHQRPGATNSSPVSKTTGSPSYYGLAWAQTDLVHGDYIHDQGYKGAGKLIVVLDEGFAGLDTHTGFDKLRNEGRLLETYNIRQNNSDVFSSGDHGMQCLSAIAGFDAGDYVGSAPEAEIAVYATEDNNFTDAIYELDNLIAGIERADSIGADVICASVVYNIFFSPYYYSFTKAQLDGHTTNVSRAVNMAVAKGIFYVTSAGNEGGNPWNYLDSPGDADSALTIGAVDFSKNVSAYSSPGPNASGRVKPELCFLGDRPYVFSAGNAIVSVSGTSFAAPQAAGYAACLLQAFPNKSLFQVRNAMIRSADEYTSPKAQRGYGVPDFRKIFDLLGVEKSNSVSLLSVHPNPFKNTLVLTLPERTTRTECSLYDLLGRNIPVRQLRTGIELRIEPLRDLPTGVYVLKAEIDGVASAIRVIHE